MRIETFGVYNGLASHRFAICTRITGGGNELPKEKAIPELEKVGPEPSASRPRDPCLCFR
jgi:hypothetical protein